MRLYHVCDRRNLGAILGDGLRPGSYLTNDLEICAYYAEGIADEGGEAAMVAIELGELVASVGEPALLPDIPSIAEPITTVLRMSSQEVIERWSEAAGTYFDSLEIVRSLKVSAAIPANLLGEVELSVSPRP